MFPEKKRRCVCRGILLAGGVLLWNAGHLSAEVRLGSPFTSHMVLQRGRPVPVWGVAAPGEKITLRFGNQSGTATAASDGAWRIDLNAMPASSERRDFVVSGSATPKSLVLEDVLVGEVWLASGQSNMDFTVSKTRAWYGGVPDEEVEIKTADYPRIRMFSGERAMRETPRECVGGRWLVCNPENVPGFSAVAYFFARDLHQTLNVPVGILCIAYGGSTAEAWIRREALAEDPALRPMIDKLDATIATFHSSVTDWKRNEEDRLAWERETILAFKEGRRSRIAQNKEDPAQNNHNPTVLFNGMLHPIIPYAMRGVIWYQGESITNGNAGRELYPLVQATLVRDWRKLWNIGDFPFYIVQLASHETTAPQVRQAQATILKLPNTGMAVTIDIGERKDIHPRNKMDVGIRLAKIALAKTYKRNIEYSGPWLESARMDGSTLRLAFSHAAGGLVANGGPLRTIEIAGADGKFVPAESSLEGNIITARHPDVTKPVSARYAWSGYPEGCNLYNQAGLPAAPFHTDHLPLPAP